MCNGKAESVELAGMGHSRPDPWHLEMKSDADDHIQFLQYDMRLKKCGHLLVKCLTLMIMWGFGVYLMRHADYLYGRRGRKKCDVCGKKFDNVDDMKCTERTFTRMQS